MRRSYTISEYEEWIAGARDALPNSAITTDVMAGFPGETSQDAEATAEACVRIGFGKLHVFRYSQRPGTIAAGMIQVPPQERARRAGELRDLGERLRSEFVGSRIGEEGEVLVERMTDEGRAEGTTSDYLRVSFHPSASPAVGGLERVLMTGSRGEMVLAKTVDSDA
jgi:threonylcarbamoyladenosine tRNA methylthiotransferase MtaB